MTAAEGFDFGDEFVHAGLYKLDISYPSSRNHPRYQLLSAMWDKSSMASDLDIETIRTALRRAMARTGVKPTTLSLQVGTSKTLVKDLLEKTDDVRLSTLSRLAGALGVSVESLLEAPRVPIVGYIGAGGVVVYQDMGNDDDNSVIRPPGISCDLDALVVRGASMLPKYKDGDVIYVRRDPSIVCPDYVGEDCAVRLKTGETYIKQLTHGSAPGLYTLRSLNAEAMVDVELEWATIILFIMPARARQLIDQSGS